MMRCTMRPRLLVPLALAALAPALAAPADAGAQASIRLAPGCYESHEQGSLTGKGFTPNATWTAKLDHTHTLGSGHTDAKGRIDARFTAPAYHGTAGTRKLTLTVGDGHRSAQTSLLMTPLSASFTPRTGDPATMRVRWRVLGLTPHRGVYVHYIQPNGRPRRTVRIGTTHADCELKTGPIALFPFDYTLGRWTFQVDASPRYSAKTLPRLLIGFEIKKPPQPKS
jgi:hypothetical protein